MKLPIAALFCASLLASIQASAAPPVPPPTAWSQQNWVGTWAAATMPRAIAPEKQAMPDTTYRNIVHTSIAGSALRVRLSNEYGLDDLKITEAHVALGNALGEIKPDTDHVLTFHGSAVVTIPAGAFLISDAVPMALPAFSDLAISIAIPAQTVRVLTFHALGSSTNYDVPGNAAAAPALDQPGKSSSWFLLKSVDVLAAPNAAAIVTFGDSITDGVASTRDKNQRWPDLLAQRLAAAKNTRPFGILNLAISGNRVLHDSPSHLNAIARFDRDVLSQSGVKYIVVLESINDIGVTDQPKLPSDPVTADQLINGLNQLIIRAHEHGIRIYGATLTPFMGAAYSAPAGEAMRQAVNTWIRTSGAFDAVIDFDKATQDPAHPDMFLPLYDHGDHLHPTDAGMKAMADSIDLKLFQ